MSTSAQSIIDAIDAAILAMLAGGGAQTLSVEGKSITYQSLTDLQKARGYYAGLLAAPDLDGSVHRPIKVYGIRMGRPE